MPYLVRCYYRPGAANERFAVRAAHIEYVITAAERLILAGGLCNERNEAVGLFLALQADTRADAQRFLDSEPYFTHGLFDRIEMESLVQFVPHENPDFLQQELRKERLRLAQEGTERNPGR